MLRERFARPSNLAHGVRAVAALVAIWTLLGAPRAVAAEDASVRGPVGAAMSERYPADESELKRIEAQRPDAAELVVRAEGLAAAGHPSEALQAIEQAVLEIPYNALILRRKCELLTALHRRDEAVMACLRATQVASSELTLRSTVRAYLFGGLTLEAKDVAGALMTARTEINHRPLGPFGYEALGDIAERIGDTAMLQYCAERLRALAPAAPQTRHVLSLLRPPWWAKAAWLVILAAFVGTFVHAARTGARKARSASPSAAAAAALLLAMTAALPAHADSTPSAATPSDTNAAAAPSAAPSPGRPPKPTPEELRQWTIDDNAPDKNIPGEAARERNPVAMGNWLVDILGRAGKASKRGDHEQAVKYYKALALAVPDRSTAFSKLCTEYEALGRRDDAIASCALALLRGGVLYGDYLHYFELVLGRPGRVSEKDLQTLLDIVDHVRKDPDGGETPAERLLCDIGVKTRDAQYLRECTAALSRVAPDDPRTITYMWSLAMVDKRYDDAMNLIARAKVAGMKIEGAAEMERETASQLRRHRLVVLLASASAMFGLSALILFVSRRIRQARARPPAAPAPAAP